jgi:hypothetical protein
MTGALALTRVPICSCRRRPLVNAGGEISMSAARRRKALCDNASDGADQVVLILNVRPAGLPAIVTSSLVTAAVADGFSMKDHDEFLDSVG